MATRNRSIKAKDGESVAKLLTALVRKADENTFGKLIIEAAILLSARSQSDGSKDLRAAAIAYGIDTDAVAFKVKQEFAAKRKRESSLSPFRIQPRRPIEPLRPSRICGDAFGQVHLLLQAILPALRVVFVSLEHVGAFNIGLVPRKMQGAGKPQELKNRMTELVSSVLECLVNSFRPRSAHRFNTRHANACRDTGHFVSVHGRLARKLAIVPQADNSRIGH